MKVDAIVNDHNKEGKEWEEIKREREAEKSGFYVRDGNGVSSLPITLYTFLCVCV